ncbi:MBL fold metallo-hydrolase RNA specificity domain-containing protein [Mycoplasmopsis columbina]|uniref:MBL fold metallo-hydrolase RNA specificity domain-containing protein n=1 Tax=Mycoplasmopsis columbina TaxID=114881 RepID=UPI0004A6E6A4|nr:ribonuclease J [Mycoplasmopsis columbina]VEU76993.1 hydrolase [Mycoplasmopsis columbina]
MRDNHINLFALGGLDENGKNCYVLEYNDKIYIINSGTKIPINSNNGVDTLIPSFDYLIKNKHKIEGIFITDVKNETFSALPWLLMKLPDLKIYTSEFNKIMILDRLSKYKIANAAYKVFVMKSVTKVGEIFVQPIELAGSMPGHLGFDFITPNGDILFMFNFVEGDLGIYGKLNFQELAKNFQKRKLLALVVDAGRANYAGKAFDKISLPISIREVFLKAKENERIIIGAYDEEMAAIQQILDLAYQTSRPIVTYGKTYGQVFELIRRKYPDLKWPKLVDYKNANKTNNAVILVTGSIERLYSRFLRITDNNDVFLKLQKNDNVIFLAPAINGLESLEAVTLDEIARITPKISDVTATEFYRHRPARQDLIDLVNITKPEYVIPVQGLYRYLTDAARYISQETKFNQNHCLLLQNGKIAHFINGKLASTKGKVKEIGETIIDGFGIGDISSEVITERELLGRDGVILVSGLYNSKTKLITSKLQINFVGVIDKENKKEAQEIIKASLAKILDTDQFDGLKDFQNRARQVIKRKIFKTFDKEPMVIVSLVQM